MHAAQTERNTAQHLESESVILPIDFHYIIFQDAYCTTNQNISTIRSNMGLSENRVYIPNEIAIFQNGIMISKTIGFRYTPFSDTPTWLLFPLQYLETQRNNSFSPSKVEVLTTFPVERYEARELLEDAHHEMARGKKLEENLECLGEMIFRLI